MALVCTVGVGPVDMEAVEEAEEDRLFWEEGLTRALRERRGVMDARGEGVPVEDMVSVPVKEAEPEGLVDREPEKVTAAVGEARLLAVLHKDALTEAEALAVPCAALAVAH